MTAHGARYRLERLEGELCSGMCLTGSDVGVPSNAIAYAHPDCDAHGDVQSDYGDLLIALDRVVNELELNRDDALERIKKTVELYIGPV